MPLRLLDLFCGAGGASMGYHRAGFEVVGVDIRPQPRYPFTFVQWDALDYVRHYGSWFNVIHASPPCQGYSRTRRILEGKGLPNRRASNLVPETRAVLEGHRYIIENVPGAPLIDPIRLCGTMFDLRVYRHRLFETNIPGLAAPPHVKHVGTTGSHRGYSRHTPYITVGGHNFNAREGAEAMGMYGIYGGLITRLGTRDVSYRAGSGRTHFRPEKAPLVEGQAAMGKVFWMTRDELCEAIPPTYTEYLGRQILAHLESAVV